MYSNILAERLLIGLTHVRQLGLAARQSRRFSWLANPTAYAASVPIVALLGVGTTLAAAWLLSPAEFGTFTLLSTLFLCASRADLGLSQLADRTLTAEKGGGTIGVEQLLATRWRIGIAIMAIAIPVSFALAYTMPTLGLFNIFIAVLSGSAFMIANGGVTIFRAQRRVWEFTVAALILQIGLTAPRLAGLMMAGVMGCFLVLTVWYIISAILLSRPETIGKMHGVGALSIIAASIPLFAFDSLWIVFNLATRWVSAALSSPAQFGLFAFASNISFALLGILATIAQVRYPALLKAASLGEPQSTSKMIEREVFLVSAFLTVCVLLGVFLSQPVLGYMFPPYIDGIPALKILLTTLVPLGAVSWVLPIGVALCERPWREAAWLFGPALTILAVFMYVGQHSSGLLGQSLGVVGASLVLVGTTMSFMSRLGLLSRLAAVRTVAILTGLVAVPFIILMPTPGSAAEMHSGMIAKNATPTINAPVPEGWKLVFNEPFDSLRLWSPKTDGIWEPLYPWGARTIPTNDELQYYVDPRAGQDDKALAPFAPFVVSNGVLSITARKLPVELKKVAGNLQYASGMLTTHKTFQCTYCLVAMRARLPRGQGLWPAFWMIPVDQTWPPEIDIMEVLGHDTQTIHQTAHWLDKRVRKKKGFEIQTGDLAADFHEYAMIWNQSTITWYLDGKVTASLPTPPGMHKPMYIVMNLAVGGWARPPRGTAQFPAHYEIDWVRAFATKENRKFDIKPDAR